MTSVNRSRRTREEAELPQVRLQRSHNKSSKLKTRISSCFFKIDTTALMIPAIASGFGALVASRVEKKNNPLLQITGFIFRKLFGFAYEALSLPAKVYAFGKSLFAQMLNLVFLNKSQFLRRVSNNCRKQLTRVDVGSSWSLEIMGRAYYLQAKPAFREYGKSVKLMALHTDLYQ